MGDRFYKFRVNYITLDEKSGMEKKTAVNMIAQAHTLKEAIQLLEEAMKSTIIDYSIAEVKETNIIDVFTFEKND